MKLIEIKTIDPYFSDTWNGDKPVEIRLNDRDYQEGDILWQRHYDPMCASYSGRSMLSLVSKILIKDGEFAGLTPGYIMMGIVVLRRWEA